VQLLAEHERELSDLVRAHSTPQRLAERALIILLAAAGLGIEETPHSDWGFGARPPVTGDVGGGMRRQPTGLLCV
jgi:hypothetical protein